jgi:co-chaperonin GroES (HSP10)
VFQPRFLEQFKKIADLNPKPALVGSRMIVEMLPEQEVKRGGIIIAADTKQVGGVSDLQPVLALVLWSGEGTVDENGNEEPCKYSPGEVVLVSKHGVRYYSSFPGIDYTENKIALTRESEVHVSWESLEAFEQMVKALSAKK